MIASSSSAPRMAPIDTTLSRPAPILFSIGRIFLSSPASSSGPRRRACGGSRSRRCRRRARPTVKPRAASGGGQVGGDRRLAHAALARRDGDHAGGGRDVGVGRVVAAFQRARAMRPLRLVGRHLAHAHLHLVDAGQAAHPQLDVLHELGPQRAAGGGQGDGDLDVRRRHRSSTATMPRSTTLSPSSGSMTPKRAPRTASRVGIGVDFTGPAPVILRWTGCPCSRRSATTPATPSTSSWPARPCRCPPPRSPTPSTCTPTRCGPTSSACATSACSRWRPTTGARWAARSTATRWPADAPSLGLEPSSFRCWPACWRRGRGRRGRRRPGGRAWAGPRGATPSPAPRGPDADPASRPSPTSWPTSASTRPWPTTVPRTTIAFTHCPFRELAEAFPDLVCNLHRGIVEGFVEGRRAEVVVSFATLADRDPCRVDLVAR